jgi:hypothetical protein
LCCWHGSKRRGNVPPKSQIGLPDWSNKRFIYLRIDSIRLTRFMISCQHARRDNVVVCVLLGCEWDCGNRTGCLLPPKKCVLNFDGVGLAMTYQVYTGGVRRNRYLGASLSWLWFVDVICSNATIGSVALNFRSQIGICIRIFGSCHLALSVGLAGSPNHRSDFGASWG